MENINDCNVGPIGTPAGRTMGANEETKGKATEQEASIFKQAQKDCNPQPSTIEPGVSAGAWNAESISPKNDCGDVPPPSANPGISEGSY